MKPIWGIAAVLLTFTLAGCAPRSMSGDVYSRERAQRVQTIEYGEVLEARPILIEGTKSGLGALGGGVLGGALGSGVGRGAGSTIAVVGGAIIGWVAGSAVEEGATRQPGVEVTIRMDTGRTIALVQGMRPAWCAPGTGSVILRHPDGLGPRDPGDGTGAAAPSRVAGPTDRHFSRPTWVGGHRSFPPAHVSFFSRDIFLRAASARHASERLAKGTHRSRATGGFARVNAAPFPARCASYRASGVDRRPGADLPPRHEIMYTHQVFAPFPPSIAPFSHILYPLTSVSPRDYRLDVFPPPRSHLRKEPPDAGILVPGPFPAREGRHQVPSPDEKRRLGPGSKGRRSSRSSRPPSLFSPTRRCATSPSCCAPSTTRRSPRSSPTRKPP